MYPVSSVEAERLDALRALRIVGSPPEPQFDAVARTAQALFRTPIALVAFTEADRHWLKAKCGLRVDAMPREGSLCQETILSDGILVVEDTRHDERFRDHPLAWLDPGIRFYAGAPLVLRPGLRLGTICVMDHLPRSFSGDERRQLQDLAEIVVGHLRARELQVLRDQERELRGRNEALIHEQSDDLKRRTAELQQRDRYLALAAQMAGVGHWRFVLPEGRLFWSDEVYRIHGLEPGSGEVAPALALSAFHPEDRAHVERLVRDAVRYGRPYEHRSRLVRPDGTVRHVVSRAAPEVDQYGNTTLVGLFMDITSFKQTEAALNESEARFRALFEGAGVGAAEVDLRTGIIQRVNQRFCEIVGRDEADLVGVAGPSDIIHPEDWATKHEARFSALNGGQQFETELRYLRPDGSVVWASVQLIPAERDEAGRVVSTLGLVQDITERIDIEKALAFSEERLRLAAEATSLGIWDVDLRTGRREWSTQVRAILGLPPSTPAERHAFLERVHPDHRMEIDALINGAQHEAERSSATFRVIRADDGQERWVNVDLKTVCESGSPVRRLGTIQDITERKLAEDALRDSEHHHRALLEALPTALYTTDATGRITYYNKAAVELWGHEPELGTSRWCGAWKLHWTDGTPLPHAECPMALALQENRPIRGVEAVAERPDGTRVPFAPYPTPIRDASGALIGAVNMLIDLTEIKAAQELIRQTANQDPLTGLPNRAWMNRRLRQALLDAERNGTSVSLLLIDLDDFKDVNDTLGHDAGDALLMETAARLSGLARDCDTVARLGGDEFAVILVEPLTVEHASRLAEEMLEALRAPFDHEGRLLACKASIGVAGFPDHHRDIAELMKDADIALYRAKAQGRNRVVTYSPEMRAVIEQKVTIGRQVREAIAADQIVPFYQPKICLSTGRIEGFEALARWQHPTKGILTPGYFGSVFEDLEIAAAIGERMVEQVAADAREWLNHGLACGRVAVNLSTAEFADPNLAEKIFEVLERRKLPSTCFEVEVTETVFLGRRADGAAAVLQRLHDAGITVALDDFGTGFASLTHLKQFPVDRIKIDQSFIRDLEQDAGDAAIVAAVVSLGRSLEVQITAEGVETTGQAERLREMGCHHAQGYLYAKPLAASRVPWLLSNWRPRPSCVGSDLRVA